MRETVHKKQTRFTYSDGPILYVGQQIVRQMQESGHDAKIFEHFRTPERQAELLKQGATKAGPWDSAHQIGLAVDIIDAKRGWPPFDDPFWEALSVAVKIVGAKLGIDLEHGYDWGWDAAHIELKHYRRYRDAWKPHILSLDRVQDQMAYVHAQQDALFAAELPTVWKQHRKAKGL